MVDEGFEVPNGSLLRIAVKTIRKEKLSSAIEQLIKACEVLFDWLSYIAFKSPKETRLNITVLFRASNPCNEKCFVLRHIKAVRKEMAIDRVEVKIDVDTVFAPS